LTLGGGNEKKYCIEEEYSGCFVQEEQMTCGAIEGKTGFDLISEFLTP